MRDRQKEEGKMTKKKKIIKTCFSPKIKCRPIYSNLD